MTRRRFYEILPGALIWTTLISAILLSFIKPLWMVAFIILFDFYWLLRILYFIPFLITAWRRYRVAAKTDWQQKLEGLAHEEKIHHLIFLPTYKESYEVIRETLLCLTRASYPVSRMSIVLGGEAREEDVFLSIAQRIQEEFQPVFAHFFVTVHPKDLPNEIPGKGSNLHFMAQTVVPRFLEKGFDPEWTIVSSFDVDTIVHAHYFSLLTYTYLTIPEPTRSSYQPVPLYNKNLWESPAAVRVAMFGTTFWLMTEQARSEGMMTFSSHSMSLRMLMDVGYWQKDVVSEDSRIFLQALCHYHGHYRVTPLYLPVSMDTVMQGDYWKAIGALYKQQRRWAWGVENTPYLLERLSGDRLMPFWIKVKWIFKQMEGMYTWGTASMLTFILGYLPFWTAPAAMREYALFQNTPFTLQWMMRLAMIGVLVSATLALTLLPPAPKHWSKPFAFFLILIQWALLPFTFVILGSVPAIDAQTRLMLGRYLGFQVSPKRKIVS